MNAPKVIWKEGMLLRPQHFQQNDRYLDQQLKQRTLRLLEHAWGFFELELDAGQLEAGKVVLVKASGVLPDGTLFEVGGSGEPLALTVPINTQKTSVELGLPLISGNHLESRDPEHGDVLARYVAGSLELSDSHVGNYPPSTVDCGKPDFRLMLAGNKDSGGFITLKIAQVLEVTSSNSVRLDGSFVPSYLNVARSPLLLSYLNEIVVLLNHRGDTLAKRIRSSGSLGSAEMGDFLMLQLINRHEPQLRDSLGRDRLHPQQLFRELLALLGELSTFAAATKRPAFTETYQHRDQALSFQPLMAALRQALSMVLEQHAIELPLRECDNHIQVAALHDHSLVNSAAFVLAANAHCEAEQLRSLLPAQLKIGSVENIYELINRHLQGIVIRALPVAPREIPFHTGKSYFALDLTEADKAELTRSGGIALHMAGEFPGLQISLWAIRSVSA